jgi:hypothetical protein
MKFGKEMDAASPCFDLPCLPYKRMKKVLKYADETHFFDALKASLRELEEVFKVVLAQVVACSDGALVIGACKLASWVQLQRTAVRKIVKKCDKRHTITTGAAWFHAGYDASTLFGASSELLHELLVSLSLDEHGGACVDPLCCVSDARVLAGIGGVHSGSDPDSADDESSADDDGDDADGDGDADAVKAFGFFSRKSFRRDYLDAPDPAAAPSSPPPPTARTPAEDAALREAVLRRMGALDDGGRCAPGQRCGPGGCEPRGCAVPKRTGPPPSATDDASAKRPRAAPPPARAAPVAAGRGERLADDAATRARAPCADKQAAATLLVERLERLLVDLGARANCPGPSVEFPAPCSLIGFDLPPLPPFV